MSQKYVLVLENFKRKANISIVSRQTEIAMTNHSLTINTGTDKNSSLTISLLNIKKAALILRAINHRLRQQILKQIDEYGKITVTELYMKLRLEQSVASQHLAILRKAGFVKTERERKFIYYSINSSRFQEVNTLVSRLIA
jgi:DNA-binding transcriptional ArsR family regulator